VLKRAAGKLKTTTFLISKQAGAIGGGGAQLDFTHMEYGYNVFHRRILFTSMGMEYSLQATKC